MSACPIHPRRIRSVHRHRAFSLVEILVVLAILGIVATVGIPAVFHAVQKGPMRQATSDLVEACQNARMTAILLGTPAELVINAVEGSLAVRSVEATPLPTEDSLPTEDLEVTPGDEGTSGRRVAQLPPFRANLPESVAFKQLVVNLQDLMDSTEARVRFYPNGTCDAFTATLLSEHNEERTLTLEITTGRELLEGR